MKLSVDDFAIFSDLGEAPPKVTEFADQTEITIVRNGKSTKIVQHEAGQVEVFLDDDDKGQPFSSVARLIASPTFADLEKWARNQTRFLSEKLATDTIQPSGRLIKFTISEENFTNNEEIPGNSTSVSNFLQDGKDYPNSILVVDGPAGIGKTTYISQLALERAKSFFTAFNPLILHVESRGRVLQNITDLMAFSLQSLQVPVLYFQVPLLVKLGVVTLAIDGFDELADPYGYQGAWSQLNELIQQTRGHGSFLLSGRETFISTDSVLKSLPSIQQKHDLIGRFTIEPMAPKDARAWLKGKGWTKKEFSNQFISTLFQDGSIALRPFFLSKLSDKDILASLSASESSDPLGFLIDLMVEREAGKFGDQFESGSGKQKLLSFVRRFLEETARDLADNQTTSVQVSNLEWIAQFVASDEFSEDVIRTLVQRCGSMALLSVAESEAHRQFSHEQIQQHFLARTTSQSLATGEVPKFVRRNILGHEFLVIFTRHMAGLERREIESFCERVFLSQTQVGSGDRARLNLIALLVAAVCGGEVSKRYHISKVELDNIVFSGPVPRIEFSDVSINSVYARGADLRKVKFSGSSSVCTVFFDFGTNPNTEWPHPDVVELPNGPIAGRADVATWIDEFRPAEVILNQISEDALDLIGCIGRFVPFWLREEKDGLGYSGKKILEHPLWPRMRDLLIQKDLLEVDGSCQASGRSLSFFHFRDKDRLTKMIQTGSSDSFLTDVAKVFPR